jgi:hypothetical protein
MCAKSDPYDLMHAENSKGMIQGLSEARCRDFASAERHWADGCENGEVVLKMTPSVGLVQITFCTAYFWETVRFDFETVFTVLGIGFAAKRERRRHCFILYAPLHDY